MSAFLRYPGILAKFGIGRDAFDENFLLKDENDPYIPAAISGLARIKRLRKVFLGVKTAVFAEEEADALAEAIITAQAEMPLTPPKQGGAVAPEFHPSVHRNPERADKRAKSRMPSPSMRAASGEEMGR
jgi:hypothetical protein